MNCYPKEYIIDSITWRRQNKQWEKLFWLNSVIATFTTEFCSSDIYCQTYSWFGNKQRYLNTLPTKEWRWNWNWIMDETNLCKIITIARNENQENMRILHNPWKFKGCFWTWWDHVAHCLQIWICGTACFIFVIALLKPVAFTGSKSAWNTRPKIFILFLCYSECKRRIQNDGIILCKALVSTIMNAVCVFKQCHRKPHGVPTEDGDFWHSKLWAATSFGGNIYA